MIIAKICLSDIPKEKIFTSEKTGKKYVDLVLDEFRNGANSWGQTHSVSISQSKEEREAKTDKVFVGNATEYSFEKKEASASQRPSRSAAPKREVAAAPKRDAMAAHDIDVNSEDLPF